MPRQGSSYLRENDRIEDRIRLHRQVEKNRPLLVVEGPDDRRILEVHLDGVDIFPADGKKNVIRCARKLKTWNVASFVCVTDPDFDQADATSGIEDVHHPYAGRDLESMLISLGVLAIVLSHQGSEEKIAQCGGADALVERLVEQLAPVTALRLANARGEWGLSFDQVDLARKIDSRSLTLNVTGMCTALIQASQTEVTQAQLQAVVSTACHDAPRGRDVVTAAGVALRSIAGTLPQAATSVNVLTAQLHSSATYWLARSVWLSELRMLLTT